MHEQVSDEFDRDPGDHNRRDILIVIALIGGVLLLTLAWWEANHPRPSPPTIERPKYEDPYAPPEPVKLAEDEWLSAPIEIPMAQVLTLGDGTVTIDLGTGNVTFAEGVTPDEASRAFWKAFGPAVCAP